MQDQVSPLLADNSVIPSRNSSGCQLFSRRRIYTLADLTSIKYILSRVLLIAGLPALNPLIRVVTRFSLSEIRRTRCLSDSTATMLSPATIPTANTLLNSAS